VKPSDYDLPHHPAAALFPMMPDDQLRDLADDIKKNGQLEDIVVLDGQVLDGRNRLAACDLAGLAPRCKHFTSAKGKFTDDRRAWTPTDYVLSRNLHRRHLTAEQRREVIAAVLKANPTKSNRQVAGQVKVDDKTVGKVRRELEGRAEIPHVAERTDTKGRRQPATRGNDTAADAAGTAEQDKWGGHLGKAGSARARERGAILAHKAIEHLKQTSESEGQRKLAFRLVRDWIRRNGGKDVIDVDARNASVPSEEYLALLHDRGELHALRAKVRDQELRAETDDLLKELEDILPTAPGRAVFRTWYREMSRKYHPDKGGEPVPRGEVQRDINALKQALHAARR
jgi:hypothetical protein